MGHIAVQLALGRGADVWATASARLHAALQELGVKNIVDYRAGPFEDSVRDMDMVLDLVGLHDYPLRSLESLRRGGQLLVIPSADLIPDAAALAKRDITAKWMLVEPDYPALERLATLAARGELKTIIAAQQPLRQIEDLWRLAESGAAIGKLAAIAG